MAKRDELQGQAYELWLRRRSVRKVAEELNITKDTAAKYVNAEQQERLASMPKADREALIAQSVATKQAIQAAAWTAFEKVADNSLNKSGYLNTILAADIAIDKVQGLLVDQQHHSGLVGMRIYDGIDPADV